MNRWQAIIDTVLADLETVSPKAENLRTKVDHKIYEGEMLAANAESLAHDESRNQRRESFLGALREAVATHQEREHKVWKEALLLLDNHRLRVSDDKRPG